MLFQKLRGKLTGSNSLNAEHVLHRNSQDSRKLLKQAAKRKSKLCDKQIKTEWKNEQKYIKLLLLGPGESGKSTLIKQMEIIHGEELSVQERIAKVPYIRQNIFDSMVAILVAMREFSIPLTDTCNVVRAQSVLDHSQVCNPHMTSKELLHSAYLGSEEFFDSVSHLWEDEGIKSAYARSSEYQLLDCAAYFFERIESVRQANYIPSEQDVLRCRIMTTSITETRFSAPYGRQNIGFKVLDVGGQQGERRKWITLFDAVTAVLYMTDVSSFDQTLREDSKTNRLLESLKVFYQVITTKYLRTVSVLTFMNKIDILKQKIERGADFLSAMRIIKQQAFENSLSSSSHSEYDRQIYQKIYDILSMNPYNTFVVTDQDKRTFCEAFPVVEADASASGQAVGKRFSVIRNKKFSSSSLLLDVDPNVIKAAAYIKMLLKKIIESVEDGHHGSLVYIENHFRSYEFHFTCAVDKANIKKVIDGCKNIIIKQYLAKMGISLS